MHERIGSYRIEKVLGNGGMGLVYKGRHESLGRDAAIKTLLPTDAGDAVLRQRLLREAQAQARLQHPNIVAVYDLIDEKGELFIAMEFVDGETLQARLEGTPRGRVPLGEALPLFEQVLDALEYVHGEQIVHRDVKPSNVMVCGSRVKLADFGIALLSEAPRMTASLQLVGSPAYMSPEQLEAKRVDHRSDIYSAALVLYRMLAGRPPFEANEYLARVQERVAGPPDLRTLAPELSAGVCDAVAIALRYDREQRFPSVAAFRDALREGAAGFLVAEPSREDVTVVTEEAATEPLTIASEPQSHRAATLASIGIAASFITALTVIVGRPDREPFPSAAPAQKLATLTPAPVAVILEAPAPVPAPFQPAPRKTLPVQPPVVKPKPIVEEREAARAQELEALRQEREELAELRERAIGAEVAARTREAQEAEWAARLAEIEEDLRAERWPEAERFATGIAKDPRAPEPIVLRANALLQQAKEGRKNAFNGMQLGPTKNTIRKPSSPPRKER